MGRRHIILARQRRDTPASWSRADWNGQSWSLAYQAPSSLPALVVSAIESLGSTADLTISPRVLSDLISRGDPTNLNAPAGSQIQLMLPRGRPGADHEADHWQVGLIEPARGVRQLFSKQIFVESQLSVRLRETLTDADIAERCKLHDRRELWVRRDWKAFEIFAGQIEPYQTPPPPEENAIGTPLGKDLRTDVQLEAAARKREQLTPTQRQRERVELKKRKDRSRAVTKKAVEASEFNKAEAKKHATKVVDELKAERERKKRVKP